MKTYKVADTMDVLQPKTNKKKKQYNSKEYKLFSILCLLIVFFIFKDKIPSCTVYTNMKCIWKYNVAGFEVTYD